MINRMYETQRNIDMLTEAGYRVTISKMPYESIGERSYISDTITVRLWDSNEKDVAKVTEEVEGRWFYIDEAEPILDKAVEQWVMEFVPFDNKLGKMCKGCMSFDNEDFRCTAYRHCFANKEGSEK